MNDYIRLPRSLLARGEHTVWVYVNLLAIADGNGMAEIKANSWCREIGLTRQQLRVALNELATTNCVTNCKTNCGTNGRTNLTICGTGGLATCYPIKKPIEEPIKKPITQPIITSKNSSDTLTFVAPEFREAFCEWLDFKKRQFKFVYKTEHSLRAAYNGLLRLSGNDPSTAMQIVMQSESNGWKGLYELKNNGTIPITATDTPASRAQSRNRLRTLATGVVSQSADKLLSLYNGAGQNPDDSRN